MSFASEPGRDDGNLPEVNIVVPDDARELDRDVLAYRRELRAGRRRQRILRLFRPFRTPEFGGHAAIIPLIAACLAISLVGGALLSVLTMSPASAPTVADQQTATPSATPGSTLITLPPGSLRVSGRDEPVRAMKSSVIALIPANCACDGELQRLSEQAAAAHARLYFAGSGAVIRRLDQLTASDGDGRAVKAVDSGDVFSSSYHAGHLTVVLVYKDATARVIRTLSGGFKLTRAMADLKLPGAKSSAP